MVKNGLWKRICDMALDFFQATWYFLFFYLSLIVFSIPLIFIFLWRIFVSIILRMFYKGRYKLVPATDAFYASNKSPITVNITFILFINDFCDIKKLQKRILANISATDGAGNGNVPYEKLFNSVVKKFGFYCYENQRNSFNINQHVRICPGVENLDKIYTESEMFSMMEPTAFQDWDGGKPRWEMNVIPKIRKENTDKICSSLSLTISHVYMDGISLVQFLRNCVVDQPSPKLSLDPINPPLPRVSLIMKVALYIKLFFVAPFYLLQHGNISKQKLMHDENLYGSKIMGRGKLEISLEMMKCIRKTFNCTTQSVFLTAFTNAFKKVAERKGYKIPDEVLGGLTLALLPYPDEYPHNRGFVTGAIMPIGIEDKVERLAEINEGIKGLAKMEAVLTCALFAGFIGLLPAWVIHTTFISCVKLAYFISNVPGMVEPAKIFGEEVDTLFGIAPIVNGFRACVGIGCSYEKFSTGIAVEKSDLFKTRADLDELIKEFENELKYFLTAVDI